MKNVFQRCSITVMTTLVCIWCITAVGCGGGSQENKTQALASITRVETISAEHKLIQRITTQPARIRAAEEAPIYSKVSGYAKAVQVDIGDRVQGPSLNSDGSVGSPGQLLVELSVPEIVQQVAQKEALLAQAESDIEQANAGIKVAESRLVTAQAKSSESESGIKRANSMLEKYRSEYERFAELGRKSAVTQKVVDESRERLSSEQAGVEEALAKQKSAQAAITEAEAGLEKAKADQVSAVAKVGVCRANLNEAKTMLEYASLRAPFDGMVTRRNVDVGHLIRVGAMGEPLFVVSRLDLLRVVVEIPEAEADFADIGDPAIVRVPAIPSLNLTGKISRTAQSLDAQSRKLVVEIDLPNSDDKLRPGMYATTAITLDSHENALVLPNSAVFGDPPQKYCACVVDGKIARKAVTVGIKTPTETEIVAGLEPNDEIVRVGGAALSEGQAVQASAYSPPKP